MTVQFTDLELADCALRELKKRQWVYRRKVANGDMKQADADREIALMAEIERQYREKAAANPQASGRLF